MFSTHFMALRNVSDMQSNGGALISVVHSSISAVTLSHITYFFVWTVLLTPRLINRPTGFHDKNCILIPTHAPTKHMCTYRWLGARLQYLQCVSNWDTSAMHCTIDRSVYLPDGAAYTKFGEKCCQPNMQFVRIAWLIGEVCVTGVHIHKIHVYFRFRVALLAPLFQSTRFIAPLAQSLISEHSTMCISDSRLQW